MGVGGIGGTAAGKDRDVLLRRQRIDKSILEALFDASLTESFPCSKVARTGHFMFCVERCRGYRRGPEMVLDQLGKAFSAPDCE